MDGLNLKISQAEKSLKKLWIKKSLSVRKAFLLLMDDKTIS